MMRQFLYTCCLGLLAPLAAAAQSDCPQGLARDGVWLEFPDRAVLTRVMADGRINEMEFAHDGSYIYGYLTLPSGLVVEGWALENGYSPSSEHETVTYVGTPDPVPVPAPGVRFDGISTSTYGDGSVVRSTVNLVVGEPQPVTIGDCTYTGLPVDVTRVEMGGGVPQRDAMMYLSELGLTIYLAFAEMDAPTEVELPISISLDPPRPAEEGDFVPEQK